MENKEFKQTLNRLRAIPDPTRFQHETIKIIHPIQFPFSNLQAIILCQIKFLQKITKISEIKFQIFFGFPLV